MAISTRPSMSLPPLCGLVFLALSACATPHDDTDAANTTNPLDDPKVGEQVNRLCFASSISGFTEWKEGDGVIVRKGVRDQYLITLAPGCFPLRSAQAIGVTNRFGSGCLDRADKLYVSSEVFPSRSGSNFDADFCRISNIYKWNPQAASEEEQKNPSEDEDSQE